MLPNQQSKSLSFRYDLNFLRAIAVIAVVLFHFKIAAFSGGYVGVDVFFVISGFLMTKIIVSGFEANKFLILKFYIARAKRIIPALAFMCLVLLLLAWFLLLPSEYRLLSKHVAASVAFLSNYMYIGEAGYFDPTSHEKWLLHTWSLSVEWQFYIIYPIILLAIRRFWAVSGIKVAIVIMAVASFSYVLYLASVNDKTLYFGLLGRVWEMLAGGIVYLFPVTLKKKAKKPFFYVGLLSIFSSILFFDKSFIWPSYLTLLPIVGTMLVIYAANNESWLVKNPIIEFVGVTSYSIYLWHWPFVVALSVFSFGFNLFNVIIGIILSFVCGYLSYLFVEQIFAKIRKVMWQQLTLFTGITAVVFVLATLVFLNNGFPIEQRFSKKVLVADQEYVNREPRKSACLVEHTTQSPHCIYGDNNDEVAVILFGDSHASAIVSAVAESVADKGSVLFIAYAGCLSVQSTYQLGNNSTYCRDFVANELDYIQENYSGVPVVMINRWSYYLKGKVGNNQPLVYFTDERFVTQTIEQQFEINLTKTLCSLKETNPVSLIKPIPEFSFQVPKFVAKRLLDGDITSPFVTKAEYRQRNSAVLSTIDNAAVACEVTVIDPTKQLCDDSRCFAAKDGRPLYYDDNHLSEFGNRLIQPVIEDLLAYKSILPN